MGVWLVSIVDTAKQGIANKRQGKLKKRLDFMVISLKFMVL
jgi:hypothetical protein